ncbi:MAG TPA: cytochrome P460 family protein [Pyrinomonadaceae bacterium]|nr:cytochrome P460 family protein [Pyrinomonadaceae bacterium]
MISSRPVKMLLVVSALLIATVAILSALRPFSHTQGTATTSPQPDPTPTGSEFVAGYRGWTRVNPEPVVMPSFIAIACFIPSAKQLELEESNPHKDKFITVYVNDTGKKSMMEQLEAKYPQGSIIVKEKLSSKDSATPELLTAMIKREPGFNPASGDWEWMVVDGSGTSVLARGKLTNCQECHQQYKGGDYVSRNYLPEKLRRKLK